MTTGLTLIDERKAFRQVAADPIDQNSQIALLESQFRTGRIVGFKRAWVSSVSSQLDELMALAPNWNGYGEQQIDPRSRKRVMTLLYDVLENERPPTLVPMSDGGIQLEWVSKHKELEVEVPPSGPMFAVLATRDSVEQVEEWQVSVRGKQRLRRALNSIGLN